MGDFIELGLEGVDKLVDKHFDKVPDKYIDPQTYKSKFRRGSKDQDQQKQPRPRSREGDLSQRQRSPSPRSSSYPAPMADYSNGRPRDNNHSNAYLQGGPFVTPPFSTMPPHQRPEYSPPPLGARDPDRRSTYDNYNPRPTQMRRRSSSYHGPRHYEPFSSSDEDDERPHGRGNQQLARRNRNASQTNLSTRSKNGHSLKEEISSQFTTSKEGLAGGALGALLGGWATHKVLESKGRTHGRGDADTAWTLLGAAVGGLAVNAVVDKFEDKRAEERERRHERDERREKSRGRSDWDERSERSRGRRDWDDDESDRRHHHH